MRGIPRPPIFRLARRDRRTARQPFAGASSLLLALVFGLSLAGPAAAEFKPEFRGLGLGLAAAGLATEGYDYFACGSNGGPPLAQLTGWVDFAQCRADERGFHEVYVEYGNATERLAELFREQFDEELWIQQYGGTRMANFPVVLSLLFDDAGIVRGFRAVTDARAALRDRGVAYLLRFRIFPLYGSADWDCVNKPPEPGQTAVGEDPTTFLNEVCRKEIDGKRVRVEAHFFRRPGQTGRNADGQFEAGQYESMTRWEVFDAAVVPPLPG